MGSGKKSPLLHSINVCPFSEIDLSCFYTHRGEMIKSNFKAALNALWAFPWWQRVPDQS